jgi:hypothetical protein
MRVTSRTLIAALALLALVLGVGCSSSGGGSSSGGSGGTSSASGGSAGTSPGSGGSAGTSSGGAAGAGGGSNVVKCNSSSTLDLSGVWAAKVELTVAIQSQAGGEISICPTPQTAQSTLYMLFDFTQDSSNPKSVPTIESHVCSVELPQVTAIAGNCNPSASNLITAQILIPQALQDAMPNIQLGSGSATLNSTAPGATITSSQVVFVAGASTQGAQLPKWNTSDSSCGTQGIGTTNQCDTNCVQSCSDLRDDDNDGFPGITVGICGKTQNDQQQNVPCYTTDPATAGATLQGQAYLDLQINPTLTGTVQSSCEITGDVNASIVYNIVGADVTLEGSAPLPVTQDIEALPTFTVQPSQSEYKMLRVDGKDGSINWQLSSDPAGACKTILAHQNDF